MTSLKTLEELRATNTDGPLNENESLRQWKESGKKVIGWTCIYVPEEIIDAAGALPVRIVQSCGEELEDANAFLSTSTCSFCRTVLQLGLDNQLDFLDGIVFCTTCECTRMLREVWERYVPIPVVGHVAVPRKSSDAALEYFRGEVAALKEKVGQFLGTNISDEALAESVRVYNRGRELVGKLYELRKSDAPPISGTEVLEVLNASCRMPIREFNAFMERLLEEIASSRRKLEADARLMVGGSILNNTDFFAALEDFGGLVVVDELCSGIRRWSDMVSLDNGQPALDNISSRYLNLPPCPTQYPMERRLEYTLALAKEYRIDGYVSQRMRYCIPTTYDLLFIRRKLLEDGIPVLELDREYATTGTGQVRTRVQAFMETIQGKKLAPA